MPRLWAETVSSHRHEVREAILHATWELVTEQGALAVTMSAIAAKVGIGRATLYKYFPDTEAILLAYHERHVTEHLARLEQLRQQKGSPGDRLAAVLHAYARISYFRRKHGSEELSALLHRGEHVDAAQRQIRDLICDLLIEVAAVGGLRDDVSPEELATYCVHALAAAGSLPSEAAVRRLVVVTLAGLRP